MRSTVGPSRLHYFAQPMLIYMHDKITYAYGTVCTHISTRISASAEGPRDELSVEILSPAAQLYKKSHLKG